MGHPASVHVTLLTCVVSPDLKKLQKDPTFSRIAACISIRWGLTQTPADLKTERKYKQDLNSGPPYNEYF